MENDSTQESLYDQLDRLEQSLDSELLELQGYLNPLAQREAKNLFASCSNETYIVKSTTRKECHGETLYREVLYRCGSDQCYTYKGDVKLNLQQVFNLRLDDIPAIQTTLKLQQNNFEQASHDYESTCLDEFDNARAFLTSELTRLHADLDRLDAPSKIFELVFDISGSIFQDTLFGCSRFYSNEYMFVTVYFEGVLYTTRVSLDEASLLDVDYSICCIPQGGHCKASTLAIYSSGSTKWMKLSAYSRSQERNSEVPPSCGALQNKECLESDRYVQSYYILKHDNADLSSQSHGQKVLFRFGSWMYRGRIGLPPLNSLQDIPNVIREMRLCQDRLDFVGDVSSVQARSEFDFDKPMRYSASFTKFIESEAVSCEMQLRQILTEETDDKTSFFIFECAETENLSSVQLVCNKMYSANGIITISMYYDEKWYLLFEESNEEFPLLDSKFPDFSTETGTKGYPLKAYPRGHEVWSELRNLTLWQVEKSPCKRKEQEIFVSSSDEQVSSENETKQRKINYLRSIIPLRRKSKRIHS